MEQKKQKQDTDAEQVDINMGSLIKFPIEFLNVDEVLKRKVSKLGNSGHISIPAKHIGKDAQVTIFKQKRRTSTI